MYMKNSKKEIVKERLISYLIGNKNEMRIANSMTEKGRLYDKYYLEYKNLKEIDDIVDELFNASENIYPLNDIESYIVRKKFGIYDNFKAQSFIEIAKSMKYSISTVQYKFCNSILILVKKIDCYIAVKNMDKDNILNKTIFDLYLPLDIINPLFRANIKCVRDIVSKDKKSILNIKEIGLKRYSILENIIHSMGLRIKDEEDIVEKRAKIEKLRKTKIILNNIYFLEMYRGSIVNEEDKKEELKEEISELKAELNDILKDKTKGLKYSLSINEENNN